MILDFPLKFFQQIHLLQPFLKMILYLNYTLMFVNQIYQSNIILEGKFTKQPSFTGSIRYDETLDDVIDKLCFSLNLTYKKQNRKIVIYN